MNAKLEAIRARTYVGSVNDLPEGEHFVILEFDSISIPGDERSRTHPGHGYPAHTETTVKYIVFNSREAWEAEIKSRTTDDSRYRRSNWAPLICRRAAVSVDVNVSVEVDCGY
jgi:hypothetical protein